MLVRSGTVSFANICTWTVDILWYSYSDDRQADIIEDFKSSFRYLEDFLNIDNPYFEGMVT